MEELAVIGGGAYSAVFINMLTQHLGGSSRTPRVTVFERSAAPWAGRAFQEDTEPVLLNTPAGWMSASPYSPSHFLRWLIGRLDGVDHEGSSITENSMVPRPLYGEYLRQVVAEASERASRDGGAVDIVRDEISGASRESDSGIFLHGRGRSYGPFDRVLMSVGHETRDPYDLTGAPGYISDPYPLGETVAAVPADAPVLVIGTGLTAVDVALAMLRRDRTAPVVLTSRTGLLPSVRTDLSDLPAPEYLTRERLGPLLASDGSLIPRIADLIDRELRTVGTTLRSALADVTADEEASTRLGNQLSEQSRQPWRGVLVRALKDFGACVYHAMREDEKSQVVNLMHPHISSFGIPMPVASARKLMAGLQAGDLRVVRGLDSVRTTSCGFIAGTPSGSIEAAVAFNATSGPVSTWSGATGDLIRSLVDHKLARLARFGGVQVDQHGQVLCEEPSPDGRIAVLGSLLRGSHYYIDAVVIAARQIDGLLHQWYPDERRNRTPEGNSNE
ncbi:MULTISPECIES: FAD/NAD(P)-binding protein [unclassified Streptomyces]|uniref:FAD/NAD(P)-binding protein n=1 Tax=Streptomyces sp. NPDC127532 TaxID=3345399 RepID=UPI00362A29D3